MVSIRSLDKTMVFLCVCVLYNSIRTDSRPLSRRSVSEVQLMHSVGVRKHIQQRQDWLQEHMQDIHTAPMHGGKISSARIMMEHSPSKGVMPDTPKRDVVETLEIQ
ncbi:parathyroid hormone 1a [Ictalurus furcatus]|uniref:parathyroid hormone 1a n=1 Tax=Ictalurus furcatus TaxID=66913 RepID=UPI0023504808|nr:parathyroid hormone 1a [Ictalurus furcatus]